jgi:hypothetical protein
MRARWHSRRAGSSRSREIGRRPRAGRIPASSEPTGAWHLLIRAAMSAIATAVIAEEAMPGTAPRSPHGCLASPHPRRDACHRDRSDRGGGNAWHRHREAHTGAWHLLIRAVMPAHRDRSDRGGGNAWHRNREARTGAWHLLIRAAMPAAATAVIAEEAMPGTATRMCRAPSDAGRRPRHRALESFGLRRCGARHRLEPRRRGALPGSGSARFEEMPGPFQAATRPEGAGQHDSPIGDEPTPG